MNKDRLLSIATEQPGLGLLDPGMAAGTAAANANAASVTHWQEVPIAEVIDYLVETDELMGIQQAAEAAKADMVNATPAQLAALKAAGSMATLSTYGGGSVNFGKAHHLALIDDITPDLIAVTTRDALVNRSKVIEQVSDYVGGDLSAGDVDDLRTREGV